MLQGWTLVVIIEIDVMKIMQDDNFQGLLISEKLSTV